DTAEAGGLALSTQQVGLVYGTIGVIGLLVGGIVGGICISRGGLKKWILPMAFAINVPDLLYVLLAYTQTDSFPLVIGCVLCEQLGYGFGFTAFTMYLVYVAQGLFKTAHYSIGTGLMALGMMVPGMIAGYLQEWTGYPIFFVIVCILTIPGIFASYLVMKKLPADFGKMDKSK
ncbi:MAG: MFS transporter, partial [Bacteroidales bacterium]|nr:MFS transporter [Bacteroidales bacterium]